MNPLHRNVTRLGLVLLLALSGGCMTRGAVANLVRELGKDPATVHVAVSTIYGTLKLSRVYPATNASVSVTPDGTITIQTPVVK